MDTFIKQASTNIDYELTGRGVGKYIYCPNRPKLEKKKSYLE